MLRNPGLRKSVEQPVLDLNFAASQIGSNGAPDSRIDFSRGSNAYFVDSDGLVKKSPHNLQVYSQDFDNAAWSKARVTVSANATTAPDGTLTADKIVETAESGAKYWRDFASAVAGERFFFSVFAKAAERKYLQMWTAFGTGGNWPQVWNVFDVEAGTVIRSDPDGDSATIEDVGNGWFRCTTSITADSSGLDDIGFGLWDGSGTVPTTSHSYVGDGSSGLFLWGAQLSQHSTLPVGNPYIKTEASAVYAARLDHDPSWFMSAAQEQNLLEYSEMLDNSGWTKYQSTVTANAAVAPDGTTTAEKLASSNTLEGAVIQDVEGNPSVTYVFSIYLKKDEFDEAELHLNYRGGGSSLYRAIYDVDLTAGTIAYQAGSTATTTITDDGDGWFRVTISQPSPASTDTVRAEVNAPVGNASGDGILVWGAQLEVGSTASTYHRTEGQPYYGEGATPKGLLIEEARTNTVTYSEDFSQSIYTKTGVTATDNSVLSPSGEVTGAFIAETSATSNHNLTYFWTIDANETLTVSYFIKKAGRDKLSLQNYGPGSIAGGEYVNFDYTFSTNSFGTAGAGGNTTLVSRSATDYGNGWVRIAISITYSGGTSGSGSWRIYSTDGSGTSYAGDTSKGFYVWGAQVEEAANSFPTSYIKTTGSTVTRNADVATMGPTVAPDKLGPELVTNGTYPVDTNGWAAEFGCTISQNSGSLRVAATTSGVGAKTAIQTISNFVVGRRYRVSYLMVGNSVSGSLQSRLRIRDGFTNVAEVYPVTNGQTRSVDFTATNTTLNVQLRWDGLSGTGIGDYVDFDNVSVKEILPGQELVTNGTFDTDVSNWVEFQANSSITFSSGAAIISSNQYNDVRQVLSLVEGRRYRASMDVITRTSGAWFFLLQHDSTLSFAQGSFPDGSTQTFDFTAGAVNTLRIYPYTTTNPDTIKVDNISVRELYPFEQYNPAEGTLYSLSSCTGDDTHTVLSVHADSFDNYFSHTYRFGNSLRNFSKGGGSTELQTAEAVTLSNRNEIATTYDGTSMDMSANGSDETTGALGADIVGIHEIAFGLRYTANQYSGHIERVQYFPRALPKVTLQSLTSD